MMGSNVSELPNAHDLKTFASELPGKTWTDFSNRKDRGSNIICEITFENALS